MTASACLACLIVWAGLNLEPHPNSWETVRKWGLLPAEEIRSGKLWGLVTCVFVHLALWHVGFNVYWLWILGGALERIAGPVRWIGFFLGAAVVSSAAELAVTDATGLGASGVGYALFGVAWVTRRRYTQFGRVLNNRLVLLFLAWLAGCIVVTALHIFAIGNAAHVAGLLFGAAVGVAAVRERWRAPAVAAVGLLLAASLAATLWAPWSPRWLGQRAYQAHLRGDYRAAAESYRGSLARGGDRTWTLQNLAFVYFALQDAPAYRSTLEELRRSNPAAAAEVEREIGRTRQRSR